MLEPLGLEEIKKIAWKDIEPGMIILSGLKINNTIPHELKNYPALTVGQIYELTQKYHLRKEKEFVVAICKKGESPQKMSASFAKLETRIQNFNQFRKTILEKRKNLFLNSSLEIQKKIIDHPDFINQNLKIFNQFNSLVYKKKFLKHKPSLLNNINESITIGEVLSKSYKKKFLLPKEFACSYFLGFAYEKNLRQDGLSYILSASQLAFNLVNDILEYSKLFTFGFSEEVQEIKYPFSGREVNFGKIFFSSFLKRVMHKKSKDSKNFAILTSFYPLADSEELWKLGEKFSKAQIDLVFLLLEPVSESLVKKLSESFHANCVVFKKKEIFDLVLIEVLDSYLSEISLQLQPVEEVQLQEFSLPSFSKQEAKEEPKKEKVVKPFEFKRLKRG